MTRSRISQCSGLDSHCRGNSYCNKIRLQKQRDILHRIQSKKRLNVAEVVYGFLGKIAVIDAEHRKFDRDCYRIRHAGLRRDRLMHRQPQKSRRHKNKIPRNYSGTDFKAKHKYDKKMQKNTSAKIASKPLTIGTHVSKRNKEATAPTSLSWISHLITRLNKRPAFVRVTNNYIKASVGAALSNLQSTRGVDDESRRSERRKLRRRHENCNSLDRKSLRRGISPWFMSRIRREREDEMTKKMRKIDKADLELALSLGNSTGSSNRSSFYVKRNKHSARSKSAMYNWRSKNIKSKSK